MFNYVYHKLLLKVVERIDKDREVIVIGVEDLRKELHLVTARLKFAKTQPDQMCPEIGKIFFVYIQNFFY